MSSPAYTPPSRDSLQQRLHATLQKLTIYQPGEQWFWFQHAGNGYHMPPDLGGRLVTHPVTGAQVRADGRLEVAAHIGPLYVKGKVTGHGVPEGETAAEIVMYACEEYGIRGVVLLEGDEEDKGRIAAARKLYARFRRSSAEEAVASRRAFITNWLAQPANKGRTAAEAPPMSELQRQAQDYLDDLAEDRALANFICAHCGYDTNEFSRYAKHMKAAHKEVVTEEAGEILPVPDIPHADAPMTAGALAAKLRRPEPSEADLEAAMSAAEKGRRK